MFVAKDNTKILNPVRVEQPKILLVTKLLLNYVLMNIRIVSGLVTGGFYKNEIISV